MARAATGRKVSTNRRNRVTKRTALNTTKRKNGSNTKSSTIDDKPFRLLDLPAELRDTIYTFIARDNTTLAIIDKRNPGTLICKAAMGLVNKQVRAEFTSALYLHAPIITTLVRDFNFTHIVTFFNRLSDLEVKELSGKRDPDITRALDIKLSLSPNCPWRPNEIFLDRWLNRCVHPTKKGTKVITIYSTDEHSIREWDNLFSWKDRWSHTTRWRMTDAAKRQEMLKIVAAMRKALQHGGLGPTALDRF